MKTPPVSHCSHWTFTTLNEYPILDGRKRVFTASGTGGALVGIFMKTWFELIAALERRNSEAMQKVSEWSALWPRGSSIWSRGLVLPDREHWQRFEPSARWNRLIDSQSVARFHRLISGTYKAPLFD